MKFRRRILSPPGDLKRNNGEKRREQNKLGPVEALLFFKKMKTFQPFPLLFRKKKQHGYKAEAKAKQTNDNAL